MKYNIINTYSFCLFGIQGLIGAIFASIYRQNIIISNGKIPICL